MRPAPISAAVLALAIACSCGSGSEQYLLRNATGDFVITAVHRLDPATGLRGPDLLPDPLLPTATARIPAGEGRMLAYDELGDCYAVRTPEGPGDTVAIHLQGLLSHNIHAGGGSVPILLVNGLETMIVRVTEKSLAFSMHDYLESSTLWPAETLTVWAEPGTYHLWAEDEDGNALYPGSLQLEQTPESLKLSSEHLYRGDTTLAAGDGPSLLRAVNLLPEEGPLSLRLLSLPASADSPTGVAAELPEAARLDTMEAAVFRCPPGRYLLEAVTSDSAALRTAPIELGRDSMLVFLRPGTITPLQRAGPNRP